MYREHIRRLQKKYGEDIFDPIDAVRFKKILKEVYFEFKYRPSNGHFNKITNLEGEAMLRFMFEVYGMDVNGLINSNSPFNREFYQNCCRMIKVYRKQKEEKPLGERD